MSSDNPPYPFYPGIPFNPSFFTSDNGSGLTEAQANAKYLKKTVPDTATALETFNGGISINGTTTITGPTNINTTGVLSNVNIGSPSLGSHTIRGNSVLLNGNTNSITGSTNNMTGAINLNGVGSSDASLITIGNDTPGGITTLASDTINIGNADTVTIMNATNIKQVIKILDGSIIENNIGNTNVNSSMSVTFNKKFITPVGGAISCFTITSNSVNQFTTQYFEIYVSGANASRGGYTYKGCFAVNKQGGNAITQSSVSTLFYFGPGVAPPATNVIPVIDFSLTGQVLTLRVNTSAASTNQSFITTLTSFPTSTIRSTIDNVSEDYIITAV